MSIRTRALIFSTFFVSCIAIGCLLVSLTTNHWVRAYPRRGNSTESKGEVYLGLFYGHKNLNPGFGMRVHEVNVYNFMTNEPSTMNFWLWLATCLGTGYGLLSSTLSAIAAVLKAASAPKKDSTMMFLFASNISSAFGQILAFGCWLVQFFQFLRHNVLAVEDRSLQWHSRGTAYLGFSFYMVIASTIAVLINVIILIYARRYEKREKRRLEPHDDDKIQSAIMLY